MTNPNYHHLYWKLVKKMRKSGVKIYHRKLKVAYGSSHNKKNKITIDSNISGTLTGVIVLLHEKRHLYHGKKGKYKEFYKLKKFDRELHRSLIWRTEWNCYKYAKNTLKRWGITTDHQLLNKNWVKNNVLDSWINIYSN